MDDDQLRAAFQDLAPEVSTEGVMEALDARLAAAQAPAEVSQLRARGVRVLAVAAAIAVIALIGQSFADDGGSRTQDQAVGVPTSGLSSTSTGQPGDEPGSSLPSLPGSLPGPGDGPGSGRPGSSPAGAAPTGPTAGPGASGTTTNRDFGGATPPFTVTTTTDPAVSTSTGPTGPAGTTTTGSSTPESTTTLPPDTTPPVLDELDVSDTTVWEAGSAACPDRPHVITIQTKATDDVAVGTVYAQGPILGGSSRTGFFRKTGPTSWELELGPWATGTLAPGKTHRMDLEVFASDVSGNTSEIRRVSLFVKSATTC